jgi:hypothetical protein
MSVAIDGYDAKFPRKMGRDGGCVAAIVIPSGTCEVKAVWNAILPGCKAHFLDGTPIDPEVPLGVLAGRRDFAVRFVIPQGTPVEQHLKLGVLTFSGCDPNPGGGLTPCFGAGAHVHSVLVGDTSVAITNIVPETTTIPSRQLTWIAITISNPHPYDVNVSYYIPYGAPPRNASNQGQLKGYGLPMPSEPAGVYLLRPGFPPVRPEHVEYDGPSSIKALATQTIRLRIWHTVAAASLGPWNLAVRLYGVVDYKRTPTDEKRVCTFIKSDELVPPLAVPVTLAP